ncbi:MAG: hypothetical protein IPN76_04540 [Saprospiraceae bacterium]|nr:hypothetical protein [Saprospiraceae bacterium]
MGGERKKIIFSLSSHTLLSSYDLRFNDFGFTIGQQLDCQLFAQPPVKPKFDFFPQVRNWAFFTNKKANRQMPTANSILTTFALYF